MKDSPKEKASLLIDTSDSDRTVVGVRIGRRQAEVIRRSRAMKAQFVLPLVEKILRDRVFLLSDISDIQVHTGPGSFTGLRVGIAIANMLGVLLHISINGKPAGESVWPTYEEENLTQVHER